MTTYTVFDVMDCSETYGRGLTAERAMHEMLRYDGGSYEIRKSDNRGYACWHLYHNDNYGWCQTHRTIIYSLAEDEETARQEIAERIINERWAALPKVLTDERYDEMMAEHKMKNK